MKPVTILLLVGVLLLSACNLPFGGDEPADTDATPPVSVQPGASDSPPISSSPSGSTIFMPQQMQDGASSTGISTLTYFWIDPLPQGLAVDVQRSYADESGYSLELTGSSQSLQVMGGDTAFQAWTAASQAGAPLTVRGQPGYSYQSPGGVSLHWSENDSYYLIAGTGMDLAQVQGLVDSLKATDLAGFQARLQQ